MANFNSNHDLALKKKVVKIKRKGGLKFPDINHVPFRHSLILSFFVEFKLIL